MGQFYERLMKLVDNKNITPYYLSQVTGVSQATLSRLKNEETAKPNMATIKKLADYFNVEPEWLLTGGGKMLKENESYTPPMIDETIGAKKIPFYDTETTGGYNGHVSSSNIEVRLAGYIYAGSWFDGSETAAIRHVGDSMIEYPDGCILAVREVHDHRLLVPGRNYVIETDEYRVTKRVQRGSTANTIALYSSNEETYSDGRLVHEPFEIEYTDIRRVFSILGYVVNQAGETKLIR